ncbi:galactose-specific lectin nattectin-like [Syngnathus acus]|uniref:galactose-specific lectin nattectin-like n=1 Tax=Syngnathus acus TaxID=161584 RepID=UPI001885C3C2|nr:galactose-specific lectin nattectin-like [Syngnathus acus]
MAFALCSLFLLCGMSGLLSGVWSFPVHWKNIKCPTGWTQLDCHCYIFNGTAVTFVEAEEDCIRRGGNLVSIHNDLENKIVKQLIVDGGENLGWIGLHDTIVNNDFFWTDGSIVDFLNFDSDNSEPDGGTQCVAIQANNGLWQDDPCTETNAYVCIMDVCHGGDPSYPDCP